MKAPAVFVMPLVAALPKVLPTALAVEVACEVLVEEPPVVLRLSVAEAPTPPGAKLSFRLTLPVVDLKLLSLVVSLKPVVSVIESLAESVTLLLSARLEFVPCCVPALTPAFTPTVAIDIVESVSL